MSRVLFVSWSIGNDEFAPRRREIAVSHVDGDALFAFGTQAIGEQRKIDWSSRAVDTALLHRSKLIFAHGLGIVQETPDEGCIASAATSGGSEARHLSVRVLFEQHDEGVRSTPLHW